MLQDKTFEDNMLFVLKSMDESFYIYQFLDKTRNLMGMDNEDMIISYLDMLVEDGILSRHFAKYEKVIR